MISNFRKTSEKLEIPDLLHYEGLKTQLNEIESFAKQTKINVDSHLLVLTDFTICLSITINSRFTLNL